jgi:arginine/ornithine N-succinyltransferase beta subunit
MWLIRPPHDGDIDALHALARSLGAGMTTFPAHRDTIAHKVERSVASFAGRAAPEDAQYLLVLEDTGSGHVLGISAVYPRIGDPYGVRRHNIWHNSRRRLAECGPRLEVDVKRRAYGVASADIRWSAA